MAGRGPGMPGMEYKDYYAVLGVPRTALQAEIKKAFRKLARQHHPDAKPGDTAAERRFKDVNEANEVLGDPVKRKQYDELGANWEAISRARAAGAGTGGGPFTGFGGPGGNVRYEFHTTAGPGEFSDFFRVFFGQDADSSPIGGASGPRRGTRPSGGPGFEDILAGMGLGSHGSGPTAGGAAAGRTRQPQLPAAEAQADISLAEAYRGTTRVVEVAGKRLEVTIPPGADTGSRIRLTGKAPGGGDLFVVVRLVPDARFTRRGADLERDLPLTLEEALLGAEVRVETLKGSVLLKIPAGTQSGRTFRLSGQGMPRFKANGHGDLYVKARIMLPTNLSDEAEAAARRFFDLVRQPNPR
ncbi:MAG: J domain-containing protein [Candidatus Limnocylindrales bacterium]|nr:J domain-containing protein [Candidatus Limnocylindrales bacterium]